jgi:hypothetical protein
VRKEALERDTRTRVMGGRGRHVVGVGFVENVKYQEYKEGFHSLEEGVGVC